MNYKIKIEVNDKIVPLNPYVTKLTTKLVLSIVESLKGIDEEIDTINVKLKSS